MPAISLDTLTADAIILSQPVLGCDSWPIVCLKPNVSIESTEGG